MKRLILIATAVLFSTLTLRAQTGTSAPAMAATPTQTVSTAAHPRHHRNKQHRHHPRHHTGINARR